MMQEPSSSSLPRILLLSSADTPYKVRINDGFVGKLNANLSDACVVEWQNYQNVGLSLHSGVVGSFLVDNSIPLSDFRHVYFKSYFRYHEQATAIAETLEENHISFTGNELREYIPAYKLSQMVRLARARLPFPDTLYLPRRWYVERYSELVDRLGMPFICKATDGATGNYNYLIHGKGELIRALEDNPERHFIVQRYIPNMSDLRVVVINGRVELVIERSRTSTKTHLNNTSKGAKASLIPVNDLDAAIRDLALRAVRVMKRDIGGVDIMLDSETKLPYILEVNASPQIGSGAFEAEKIDVYTKYFREISHESK